MQPFNIHGLKDYNKKPVDQVVLDYSNPLTHKLRHAFIFQNTHRGTEFTTRYNVFDHSSGLVFGTRNNTIANFKGRQSNWFNGLGTGIPVSNGTINSGFFAFDSEVSVYTRVFYNSLTQDHALFDINDQQLVIWADWTTTPDKLGTRIYPGGGGPTGTAGDLDSPPWVSWGGGVKDTGSNTTDCYAYTEGSLDASSLAQGTAGWTSSVNYRFGVNFNGGDKKSNAFYEYIYCWEKLLSAEEFKSINDRPYQIFKPAIPIAYFIPDAAVGAAGATKNLPLMGCG